MLTLTLKSTLTVPLEAEVLTPDLIATLMAGVVAASGHGEKLCVLAPPLDLGVVPFTMSWHRRNDVHPAQKWLRQCIASLFAQHGSA